MDQMQNIADMVENDQIKMTEDGVKYLIEPNEISSGGVPKDGIPAIDNPKFVSVSEADQWIQDDEATKDITAVVLTPQVGEFKIADFYKA